MGFLSRLIPFKKKAPTTEVENTEIEGYLEDEEGDVQGLELFDELPPTEIQINMPESPMLQDPSTANIELDEDVDINYRGGLLSPTQKAKDQQYHDILSSITEDTIATIDAALKEEVHLYDVFQRIEEQGISLLTLVALDMTSEEDLAAYQMKKQRDLNNHEPLSDPEYEQEIAQVQQQVPTTRFAVDAVEMEQLQPTVTEPDHMSLTAPIAELNPTGEATIATQEGVFSSAIFNTDSNLEDLAPLEPQEDLDQPTATTLIETHEALDQPTDSTSIEPQNELATPTDLTSIETDDQTTNPPTSTAFSRLFGGLSPTEPSEPVMNQPHSPTAKSEANLVEIDVTPAFLNREPIAPPVTAVEQPTQPVTAVAPTQLPSEPLNTASEPQAEVGLQEPLEILEHDHAFERAADDVPTKAEPPGQTKVGAVVMEFEGYAAPAGESSTTPQASGEAVTVFQELLELSKKLSNPTDPVSTPAATRPKHLSEEKLAQKKQTVKKFTRKQKSTDKRVFIIWDNLNLPKLEGYEFSAVKALKDLNRYGLDTNDLLIVTAQVPHTLADELDTFLHNALEEQQPYRIVNFTKKAYDGVEIPMELPALTKEALDHYYENNQIELNNKNQLSGFQGFADFISKD